MHVTGVIGGLDLREIVSVVRRDRASSGCRERALTVSMKLLPQLGHVKDSCSSRYHSFWHAWQKTTSRPASAPRWCPPAEDAMPTRARRGGGPGVSRAPREPRRAAAMAAASTGLEASLARVVQEKTLFGNSISRGRCSCPGEPCKPPTGPARCSWRCSWRCSDPKVEPHLWLRAKRGLSRSPERIR
jgi:hypothetical protein